MNIYRISAAILCLQALLLLPAHAHPGHGVLDLRSNGLHQGHELEISCILGTIMLLGAATIIRRYTKR
jgi:hypothetical protein